MFHPARSALTLTAEDRATLAKWRKVVCVAYGSLALFLFAAVGSYAYVERPTTMAAAPSAVMHR